MSTLATLLEQWLRIAHANWVYVPDPPKSVPVSRLVQPVRLNRWPDPREPRAIEYRPIGNLKIRGEDILIIKETDGSIGAPLLMKALPESRMVLLVRDPRDIVASRLDAAREDGWIQGALRNEAPVLTAEQWANILSRHIGNAKEAYEAHEGPKALVRYEDLLSDTLNTIKRVYSSLEMKIDEKVLAQTVDKHSWEKVPEDKKGAGKFYRKATPGGWREDLTPEQVRKIEKIAAPILDEYYSDTRRT